MGAKARTAARLAAAADGRPAGFDGSPSARPKPVWDPIPVSEVAMLCGLVAIVVGLLAQEPPVLAVGGLLIGLGVLELTLREHLAGYRRHTAILAMGTMMAVHLGMVAAAPFRYVGIGALALDAAVLWAGWSGYGALWKRGVRRRRAAQA